MAHFIASLTAAAVLAIGASGTATAASLENLRWKARPVVLFAPAADDPRLSDQVARLVGAAAGLKERDMTVLTVIAADDPLRARLKAPRDGFLLVLVGKDGHVAQRWTSPQDPGTLFALIDRMPMRQDDMRRSGQ